MSSRSNYLIYKMNIKNGILIKDKKNHLKVEFKGF